ncbi:MAG: hypothetical protein AMJ46_06625 [Latescibacteria bacterium DG_63]|nr:MAG: hypothetical protein AMJ46_06625 [Latescibacteria bacterium DG_63]
MAKKRRKKEKTVAAKKLAFTRKNWSVLLLGVLVIVVGFFALSKGSITLAPILLVLGYCVIVPLAILMK